MIDTSGGRIPRERWAFKDSAVRVTAGSRIGTSLGQRLSQA